MRQIVYNFIDLCMWIMKSAALVENRGLQKKHTNVNIKLSTFFVLLKNIYFTFWSGI